MKRLKGAGVRRQSVERDRRGRALRRSAFSAGFAERLDRALGDAAREMRCSRRLVVAVALAQFLGVDIVDSL